MDIYNANILKYFKTINRQNYELLNKLEDLLQIDFFNLPEKLCKIYSEWYLGLSHGRRGKIYFQSFIK
jgi:hypothetical protein